MQSVGFVPSSILWVAGCAYELTLVINCVTLLPDNVYHESDPVDQARPDPFVQPNIAPEPLERVLPRVENF